MANETRVAAGKRFSRDLRRIREDRGVSIDDIHQETRIARSLIESFEEGGLYDSETFNEVYLRSFVRAYAEAVGISPDTVRNELTSALEGTYENALAEAYLADPGETRRDEGSTATDESDGEVSSPDRPPTQEESSSSSDPPSAGGPEGRGGIVGPARAMGAEPDDDPEGERDSSPPTSDPGGETSTRGDDRAADEDSSSAPMQQKEDDGAGFPADDSSGQPQPPAGEDEGDADGLSADRRPSWMEEGKEDGEASARPPARGPDEGGEGPDAESSVPPPATGTGETGIVGEPTALDSDSPEQASPAPGASRPSEASGRQHRSQSGGTGWFQGQRRETVWAGVGFVVVLLVLVGLGIAFFSSGSEPAPQESPSASSTPAGDTVVTASEDTSEARVPEQTRPPPANVSLGSTIPLTVRATRDVRGIRIERDDDLARPYWIEEGEAAVFPFQERAILENELGDVQLFLAGYPYPESQWDTTGAVVITRSDVETFVDTLRGASAALTTTPDTIPKGPPNQ